MAETISYSLNKDDTAELVGMLVYESFYPQNPGIIRRVVSDVSRDHTFDNGYTTTFRTTIVEVEWLKKTKKRAKTTQLSTLGLSNFEALIEDHKRKYENQTKLADALRKM